MPERFEQYIQEVCRQVRWKRAQPGLADELRTHLLDQKDACLAEGMEEDAAEAESVRQMGDPVEVGTRLDRVHRPKPQWDLMILIGVLLAAGLALQGTVFEELWDQEVYMDSGLAVIRIRAAILFGVLFMLLVYWLDYTALGLHPFLYCGLGLGIYLLSWRVSPQINYRVVYPCYLSLLWPIFLALLLYGLRGKGWKGLFFGLAGVGLSVGLNLSPPFFAGAGLAFFIGIILLLLSVWKGWMGVPKKKASLVIAAFAAIPILAVLFSCVTSGYAKTRLFEAFHPEQDPLGRGYTAMGVRTLLQNTGWLEAGTEVDLAEQLLPEAQTDFMLTWVIYCLGWWAGLALIGLLVLLLALACRRAVRQRGMLGSLLSTAAVLTLGGEVALYVMADLGFLLLGPIALPFLSYGRCYMVLNLFLAGLMMSVFREERLPQREKGIYQASPRRKWMISRQEEGIIITIPLPSEGVGNR